MVQQWIFNTAYLYGVGAKNDRDLGGQHHTLEEQRETSAGQQDSIRLDKGIT